MIFKHKEPTERNELAHTPEVVKSFLEHEYLASPYIVPEKIDTALGTCAEELSSFPGFSGLVNVGGTANGSYELRSRLKPNPASDLDYYLIGGDQLDLNAAAELVQRHMRAVDLNVDGVLNGRNTDNFLNLDQLNEIMDRGDAALLALCFQSFYGNDLKATQEGVLEAVMHRVDAQEMWDEIASFHAQSLSLHHGSFNQNVNDLIMQDFYPKKVEKFELALTPEEALSKLINTQ